MHTQLSQLVELQNILTGLEQREHMRAQLPDDLREVDDRHQAEKQALENRRAEAEAAAAERKRLELELVGEQDKLAKYQSQLMNVKNQKEYGAVLNEIDNAKRRAKALEDEILARMERVETLAREAEQGAGAFGALEAEWRAGHAGWKETMSGVAQEIAQLRERQVQVEKEIPPALLAQFRRIYGGKQGVAVARVVGASCTACKMRLRPALVQELRASADLHMCENCHRFLYIDEERAS